MSLVIARQVLTNQAGQRTNGPGLMKLVAEQRYGCSLTPARTQGKHLSLKAIPNDLELGYASPSPFSPCCFPAA